LSSTSSTRTRSLSCAGGGVSAGLAAVTGPLARGR
jgi:hypothetical protein